MKCETNESKLNGGKNVPKNRMEMQSKFDEKMVRLRPHYFIVFNHGQRRHRVYASMHDIAGCNTIGQVLCSLYHSKWPNRLPFFFIACDVVRHSDSAISMCQFLVFFPFCLNFAFVCPYIIVVSLFNGCTRLHTYGANYNFY